MNEAADFKSAVSTDFTTRAVQLATAIVKQKSPNIWGSKQFSRRQENAGGAARSRTGLAGFAIRYITALLPRRIWNQCKTKNKTTNEKGQHFEVLPFKLEREKSLELSTSTLARLRSTN